MSHSRRGFLAGLGAVPVSGILSSSVQATERIDEMTDSEFDAHTEREESIETVVENQLKEAMSEHDIPGAAAVVIRDGEVTLQEGYGIRDRETEAEVTDQTPFRIGSISKPVMWTAIARLIDAGELDLTTPVSEYIDDGIVSWDGSVTLHHLATHTGGFEKTNQQMWYPTIEKVGPLESHMRPFPKQIREPGTVGIYSNHGAALAGYVLEQQYEKAFPDAMEDLVFEPAGMETATFRQPTEGPYYESHASGHTDNGPEDKYIGLGIAPAGAMSASAADMARYMELCLTGGVDGERILEQGAHELLTTNLDSFHESIGGMTLGFLERYHNGVRILNHNGATPAFHSNLIIIPEYDFGLFISFNSDDAEGPREEIRQTVTEELLGTATVEPETSNTIARNMDLSGTYGPVGIAETTHDSLLMNLFADRLTIEEKDDRSIILDSGDGPEDLVAVGPSVYQHVETGRRIAFIHKDGEVSHFYLEGSSTAFEQVSAHERTDVNAIGLVAATLVLLSGWKLWSVETAEDEPYRAKLAASTRDIESFSTAALSWSCAAFVLFILVTTAYFLYSPLRFLSDPSPLYLLAYLLPALGAVGTGLTLCCLPKLLRRECWSVVNRLHYVITVGALVFTTMYLWYWNLLPGV